MITRIIAAVLGVGIGMAIAVAPASAADDIASKTQVCAGCHGQNGVPADPKTMPIIWGQTTAYMTKQLHDYRSGDRDNAVMAQIAKSLTQEDLRPMATYFAGKTWPAAQMTAAAAAAPQDMKVCEMCHQAKFVGGLPAPRLAGLNADYLVAEMRAFRDGKRTNNQDMPKIMQGLSDSQIDTMAKYLAAL